MHSWPHDYQNWPSYLPYPTPLHRNKGAVPNEQSVDWPSAQLAPLYLPPGSPSFQAFRYPPPGPLSQFRPTYRVAGTRGAPNGSAYPSIGPAGDIAQLPSPYYGGTNMPFARFNPEEDPQLIAAQVLDTPSSLPVEAVIPDLAVDAAAIVPLTEEEAVEAAVTSSFIPFEPELLEGLSDRMVTRLQRLETLLTKLDSKEIGTRASTLEANLLRAHEGIRGKLEGRLEGKALRRGRRAGKIRQTVRLLRARRAVKRAKSPLVQRAQASLKAQKAAKIAQIKAHYQAGKIGRGQAEYLIQATLHGKRPGEAKDIAIAAGGISEVGRVQRARAGGYTKEADRLDRLRAQYRR